MELFGNSLEKKTTQGQLQELQDSPYFVEVTTVANEASCHHCHGASRDILGSMVVLKDVSYHMGVLTRIQSYSLLFSLLGLAGAACGAAFFS